MSSLQQSAVVRTVVCCILISIHSGPRRVANIVTVLRYLDSVACEEGALCGCSCFPNNDLVQAHCCVAMMNWQVVELVAQH